MIWLAWRRHRLVFVAVVALLIVLAGWQIVTAHLMGTLNPACYLVGQSFSPASRALLYAAGKTCNQVPLWSSLGSQSEAIELIFLCLPCVLGLIFGVPLVASELERNTNRLVWTQGISRTRWLTSKWLVAVLPVAALLVLQIPLNLWWSNGVTSKLDSISGGYSARIEPLMFEVTGISLVALTLFAFALGAFVGTIIRRTVPAIFATVVLNVLAVNRFSDHVLPYLATRGFSVLQTSDSGVSGEMTSGPRPWITGYGYRFAPGAHIPTGSPSLNQVVQQCSGSTDFNCLASHSVQFGYYFQPESHYWQLQWAGAGIYVVLAAALFGLTLLLVRRWRA